MRPRVFDHLISDWNAQSWEYSREVKGTGILDKGAKTGILRLI